MVGGSLRWSRLAQAQLACTVTAVSGAKSFFVTQEGVADTGSGPRPFERAAVVSCSQFSDLQLEGSRP